MSIFSISKSWVPKEEKSCSPLNSSAPASIESNSDLASEITELVSTLGPESDPLPDFPNQYPTSPPIAAPAIPANIKPKPGTGTDAALPTAFKTAFVASITRFFLSHAAFAFSHTHLAFSCTQILRSHSQLKAFPAFSLFCHSQLIALIEFITNMIPL